MKFEKLYFMIAVLSIIMIVSFSLTISTEQAWSQGYQDRDYDGIVDEIDECPQVPETYNKFEDTDGCPDSASGERTQYQFPDSDGDGIEDRWDSCVFLPESYNDYLDYDGCPERELKPKVEVDSDSDTIIDSIDACPQEQETFNEFKDGDGCPDSLQPTIPNASKRSPVTERQCTGDKIAVLRINTNNFVCLTWATAERWEEIGIGEIVLKSEPGEGNLIVSTAEAIKQLAEKTMKDIVDEKSITPVISGGTLPITETPVIGDPHKIYSKNYFPGTEELAENEIRLTFLGTGMPFPTRNQAASGVLMEFGNGDILMFDVGSGTVANFNSMKISPAYLTKFFITHLHTDHQGDLDMFWAQGIPFGRVLPMQVWGPTGEGHALGTQAYVDGILAANYWDLKSREGAAPTSGAEIITHEFDWAETQVVYEEDNITVTSFPAIHGMAGAVSYRIDWNDISIVYSGDTKINNFMIENGQNVDLLIHEAFMPAEILSEKTGMALENAMIIVNEIHTPPKAAGVVFELTQPTMAVMYHTWVTEETITPLFEDLRIPYLGPVTLAQDFTVFNLTPDSIVIRQALVDDAPWPIVLEENADAELDTENPSELPELIL